MKNIVAMLVCAVCAACVEPRPMSFEKASATPEQSAEDYAECQMIAQAQSEPCMQMQKYEQCMTSRRYAGIPGSSDRGRCGRAF